MTPEEIRVRQLLAERVATGPEQLLAPLAQSMFLERLSRLHEPAALDPRLAGIVSLFIPQAAAEQRAAERLTEQLIGPGVVPRSREAALAPFASFATDVAGSPVPEREVRSQTDLAKQVSEVLLDDLLRRLARRREAERPPSATTPPPGSTIPPTMETFLDPAGSGTIFVGKPPGTFLAGI